MSKKYLLYIHSPEFEDEKQKSALINLLLDRHYDYFQPGTLIEEVKNHEDLDGSVVGSIELASDLKTLQESKPVELHSDTFTPKPPDPETGYPCCQSSTTQCKHWQWDGVRSLYVNTLTGKTREPSY